jgi:hypothetical protein
MELSAASCRPLGQLLPHHMPHAGGHLGPPEALLGYRVQTLSARKAYVGTVQDVRVLPCHAADHSLSWRLRLSAGTAHR